MVAGIGGNQIRGCPATEPFPFTLSAAPGNAAVGRVAGAKSKGGATCVGGLRLRSRPEDAARSAQADRILPRRPHLEPEIWLPPVGAPPQVRTKFMRSSAYG